MVNTDYTKRHTEISNSNGQGGGGVLIGIGETPFNSCIEVLLSMGTPLAVGGGMSQD